MISQGRSENKGSYDNGGKAKFHPDKVESKFTANVIKMNLRRIFEPVLSRISSFGSRR